MMMKGENSPLNYLSRQVAVEAAAAEPAASSANGEDEFHDDPPVEQVIVAAEAAAAVALQVERQLDRQQTGVAAQECEAQQVGLPLIVTSCLKRRIRHLCRFFLCTSRTLPPARPFKCLFFPRIIMDGRKQSR